MHADTKSMEALSVLASAKRAVESELTGLRGLLAAFDGMLAGPFTRAVDLIKGTPGRVIVTGIGKSGHVARKIAATLSSTGTPALFLHPAEASHGDLGMITPGDVALALSWSGESPELLHVVNYCKRFGVPLIGISSEPKSALAKAATIALTLPRAAEACSIGLAPTTSTTMQMALGDALAVTLLEEKGFSAHDFRNFHPGGRLGAQLITVREIMTQGEVLPRLRTTSTLSDAILEISRGRLGGAAVVDEDGRLIGAFTDGDLRRALPEANLEATVAEHMSRQPVFVAPSLLATEALLMMTERPRPILLMFVCEGTKLVGAVHMHDLLRAGVA